MFTLNGVAFRVDLYSDKLVYSKNISFLKKRLVCTHESKQEATKVVSHVKHGKNLPGVSSPFKTKHIFLI